MIPRPGNLHNTRHLVDKSLSLVEHGLIPYDRLIALSRLEEGYSLTIARILNEVLKRAWMASGMRPVHSHTKVHLSMHFRTRTRSRFTRSHIV